MRAFQNTHPAVSFTYFVFVIGAAMFINHPVLLIEALFGAILFRLMPERGRGVAFAKSAAFYLLLFFLITITNPLFSHDGVTTLFFVNGKPFTLEATLFGVAVAVMIIAVIVWFKCYNSVMTSDKFLYLFGGFVPKLSLILSMALRFIPMFAAQVTRVSRAQKAMGLFASDSTAARFKSAARVFYAVVQWSLENAVVTGDSMRARGYGTGRRTSFSLFRFTAGDGVLLTVIAILMAVVFAGKMLGGGDFTFYPRVSGGVFSPASAAIYIAYGLLSLVPFLLECEERLTWIFSLSKI